VEYKLKPASAKAMAGKEKNNYEPDFDKLEKKNLKKVKLMFVNYPQMPTGQLPSRELFEKLVAFGKKHKILIIHDNPYSFILNDSPMSLLGVEGAKDCVIELNSLSKSHNMAGWRVGMLCGAKERIEEAKALSLGKEWQEEVNAVYRKRREKVFELLKLLGCIFSKEQVGMFVWAQASPNPSKEGLNKHSLGRGGELSDEVLYNKHVFITPGGIFGSAGEKYVRVSLCSTEEKLQEAIERVKSLPKPLQGGALES
jgi:aspartate/methionine/tyrosine aminotransferase